MIEVIEVALVVLPRKEEIETKDHDHQGLPPPVPRAHGGVVTSNQGTLMRSSRDRDRDHAQEQEEEIIITTRRRNDYCPPSRGVDLEDDRGLDALDRPLPGARTLNNGVLLRE